MSREPTIKQRLFVKYLLDDPKRNRVAAARKAGFSDPESHASKIVDRLLERAVRSAAMSIDEVLARQSCIAASDLDEVCDLDQHGNWHFNAGKARQRGKTFLIKEIEITPTSTKVKLHDAASALDKLRDYWKNKTALTDDESIESIDPEKAIFLARAIAKSEAEYDARRQRSNQPADSEADRDHDITPDGIHDGL